MLLGLKEIGVVEAPDEVVKAAASFGGGVALSKNICGSLSAAARATGLTQPTVGRHIDELETGLGVVH